jgi:hypothetical protein
MKSVTLLSWAMLVMAACIVAVLMVAIMAVVAMLLATVAVVALPFDILICGISSFSPRFDQWTSNAFDRFGRWLRMRGNGLHTS